jgi:TetR/AcrR family acrAB operon transcriptional repressor
MVRRTKEDAQETRNRILDTAVEVLNRQGVAQTSLNDIAREAGVTRGAIYWHFANKVAMFDAMIERLLCPLLFNSADRDTRLAADPLGFIQLRRPTNSSARC